MMNHKLSIFFNSASKTNEQPTKEGKKNEKRQ